MANASKANIDHFLSEAMIELDSAVENLERAYSTATEAADERQGKVYWALDKARGARREIMAVEVDG